MPLTKRRQFATLLAYLEGQPSVRGYDAYTRDDFDAHIFQIFDWLRRGEQPAQGQEDNDYRRSIFEDMLPIFNEERQHRILRDLEAVLLQRQGVLSLEDIAHDLRPITWLWPGWLPIGMITLLAARPGTGKSLLALDIAARVIQGAPWPDAAALARRSLGAVPCALRQRHLGRRRKQPIRPQRARPRPGH